MRILDNSILGRNFRLSSLVLNADGLHRLIIVGNKSHLLFLTNDAAKITELIDVKFDDVNNKPPEEAFPFLLESEYFHPYVFMSDRVEKSKLITEFKEWLQVREFKTRTHNPVRTERIEAILGIELRSRIDKIKFVLAEFDNAKSKFNGKTILPYLGNYSPTNFSTSFPKFKESFGDDYLFMEFIVDNDIEAIAKKFKEVNQIS